MADPSLPVPFERRLELVPERVLYVARPGIGALPTGTATMLLFMSPQIASLFFLLWAIWWPYPANPRGLAFAIGASALLVVLLGIVFWLLARRNAGFASAVIRAPFIKLTVTNRRVLWELPWTAAPLMEIDARRVRGAILGGVDRRGRGNAALMLQPGDPAADVDGSIHFDRMPRAERFVAAVERLGDWPGPAERMPRSRR